MAAYSPIPCADFVNCYPNDLLPTANDHIKILLHWWVSGISVNSSELYFPFLVVGERDIMALPTGKKLRRVRLLLLCRQRVDIAAALSVSALKIAAMLSKTHAVFADES